MATVTNPPAPQLNDSNRADLQRKVADPLEKLRGFIRLYVTIEGVAVLFMYLALWFWISLLVDFGFFKLFTLDWVQALEGWRGLRVTVLVALVAGLLAVVAVKVILRLMREFRNAALALVLERRFPQLLGDRLITAVELADPKLAEKYGFSQQMIDLTVQQAAEQVDKVPVQEAFNWHRLRRYGWTVLGLTLGLYLLCGAVYFASNWKRATAGNYVAHFNNVATIWFERNILLADTYWPRQAHLELVEDPSQRWIDGELKVGKYANSVPLRVRAVKWVYADVRAPSGWRAMRWKDLNKDLLGAHVPPLPPNWSAEWSVDYIETQLDKESGQLDAGEVLALRSGLERLSLQAGQIARQRRMRQLEIPDSVTIEYEGDKNRIGERTLGQDSATEFAGNFDDLKESVRFRAVAKDFKTPSRRITVVPPPSFAELYREESQPAYLMHRPPVGATLEELKGWKQRFPKERVYLGDETVTISVPAGTDLNLIGVSDKDLVSVTPILRKDRAERAGAPVAALPAIARHADSRTFEAVFKNVMVRHDLDFEMLDTDGVVGRRHVVIEAKVDTAPEVDVFIDVVRKTNQGFMITPIAMVPFSGPARDERGQERFNGRIRDDHGLSKVQYYFTYALLEASGANRARTFKAATVLHLVAGTASGSLLAAIPVLQEMGKHTQQAAETTEREPQGVLLRTFDDEMQRRSRNDIPRAEWLRRLEQPPPRTRSPLLTEFTLDTDRGEHFDLMRHLPQLKEVNESSVQQQYRLRLWVVATDNNVETGPRSSESKERFSLIVVSETVLLAEIAREEEGLNLKIEQTYGKLRDARSKLQQFVIGELEDPGFDKQDAKKKDEVYSSMATLVLGVADLVKTGSVTAWEVHNDYRRIVREEEVNRVTDQKIEKERDITKLLDLAINQEFIKAEEALREFQKSLEGKRTDRKAAGEARDRVDDLLRRLQEIIDRMDKLTKLNDLITILKNIEEGQRDNVALLTTLKKRIEEELIKGLIDPMK